MDNKLHTFFGIKSFYFHCSQEPATKHLEPDWLSVCSFSLSCEIHHDIDYTFLSPPELPAVLLLFLVNLIYRDVTFHTQFPVMETISEDPYKATDFVTLYTRIVFMIMKV
jgi:hypothetical protein